MSRLVPISNMAMICVCLLATTLSGGQTRESAIQHATTQAMSGRSGTAVVLDVTSGHLLTAYRLDVAARRIAYPGSSIKPFTLLALLQSGKVNAQTRLSCKRTVTIGGHHLDCTHPATPQPLGPTEALAYSCNSYFTSVATRLTPSELRGSFLKMGLGSTTALAPREVTGEVALAASQQQVQLEAIGEWGVRVTPLELLNAYRKLAVLASNNKSPEIALTFDGLEGSTSYGMASAAQPDAALRVAGKTGTSSSDEGQWTHAWFAGFAPAEKPAIAIVVFLEKGRGGADAAEVARQIFAAYAKSSRSQRASGGAQQ
jgi:penicillin-binding protein 2